MTHVHQPREDSKPVARKFFTGRSNAQVFGGGWGGGGWEWRTDCFSSVLQAALNIRKQEAKSERWKFRKILNFKIDTFCDYFMNVF